MKKKKKIKINKIKSNKSLWRSEHSEICKCDSNFTVRKLSGVLHAIFFFRKFGVSVRFVDVAVVSPSETSVKSYMLY